ncbi:MAG: hypothetical protein P4L79_11910 [Legionella sp.]|uniref:hypothetical protein n=1 Tax=Legionella sp. TaxID=459 RepID=UPI00283DB26B|nr:hypothetical protein [Legionella sp.]
MTERCYVALGAIFAREFREIDLQTISEKELTTLIFSEAKDYNIYKPQNEKKADNELKRTDTDFSDRDANINVQQRNIFRKTKKFL